MNEVKIFQCSVTFVVHILLNLYQENVNAGPAEFITHMLGG